MKRIPCLLYVYNFEMIIQRIKRGKSVPCNKKLHMAVKLTGFFRLLLGVKEISSVVISSVFNGADTE